MLFISFASAGIIYTLTPTLTSQIQTPNIIFVSGEDTGSIGGSIGLNGTIFTATTVPLGAGSNITIEQAVRINNTDTSAHNVTGAQVVTEDYGTELNKLSIYLSDGATRYLLVNLNTSGVVTYEFSSNITIPAATAYDVIIEGMYDDGTASGTSNTINFFIKQ
jgi:hypothetical protein